MDTVCFLFFSVNENACDLFIYTASVIIFKMTESYDITDATFGVSSG